LPKARDALAKFQLLVILVNSEVVLEWSPGIQVAIIMLERRLSVAIRSLATNGAALGRNPASGCSRQALPGHTMKMA
jgi:hypothetical protein